MFTNFFAKYFSHMQIRGPYFTIHNCKHKKRGTFLAVFLYIPYFSAYSLL